MQGTSWAQQAGTQMHSSVLQPVQGSTTQRGTLTGGGGQQTGAGSQQGPPAFATGVVAKVAKTIAAAATDNVRRRVFMSGDS